MNNISDKAVVSPKAKLGDNIKIFPFVYIEDYVEIGDNCVIFPFVSILNGTKIGKDNKLHQGAVLGALPQDFAFKGERSEVVVGDNNVIRENVIVNRGTHEGGQTVIGNNNMLMEGVHISHDTKIGNFNVFGYGTKIAGDCQIGDGVIFSSSVIENAGTRVGNPIEYAGPNNTMMEAWHIEERIRKHVANAYRLVFNGKVSVFDAALQIRDQVPDGEQVRNIIEFLNSTQVGIISK